MAQTISTIAGNGAEESSGDGGYATDAGLITPADVAIDRDGNTYIAETYGYRVRKVTPEGIITTFAGTGEEGFSGDGGPATAAQLSFIYEIALDAAGNLYIADSGNYRIRKVSIDGTISTFAGNGDFAIGGEGARANVSPLAGTDGLAFDAAGNLYVGEWGVYPEGSRVRRISTDGVITTIAGTGNPSSGSREYGGLAIETKLNAVGGMTFDRDGALYIADTGYDVLLKVTTDGLIHRVAGHGLEGNEVDEIPALDAHIVPADVAIDSAGRVFFSDATRVRYITADGIMHKLAGNAWYGFSGDGGPAIDAQLNVPIGIAFDHGGNLLIADALNGRIRQVTPLPTFTTCAADSFSGSRRALCKQICEASHSDKSLTSLIKAYVRQYQTEPPCAR